MATTFNDLSQDAEWQQSILRIWIDGVPVGTAFAIGPRIALTCHHCVRQAKATIELRGRTSDGAHWVVSVAEAIFPSDPTEADAAMLRLDADVSSYVSISAAQTRTFGELVAYGYPGSGLKQALVRINLELRGLKSFAYDDYSLPSAFALAGDPAAPGMSGGPVFDTTARSVVGMIVGGPDFDNRAIALPLLALDKPESQFRAFRVAARSNRLNAMQSGWAMNCQRAKHICRLQVEDIISRLTRRQRYDPGKIVCRESFTIAVARFLSSDSDTLVVVSGPNSGKTWAMAAAASDMAGRSLFLEAFLVDDVRSSFMTCLQRTVDARVQTMNGEKIQLIADSLAAEGEKLALFVDGVNEIEDDHARAESWIAEAISEAGILGAKLIISCRSDFWSALDISKTSVDVHHLGYFSPTEAETASSLYRVGSDLPSELGRHPLMFKILSDLGASRELVEQGRFSAIRAFVRRLIKMSPGIRSPEFVYAACERMVRDISPDEETITWDLAANHVGGSSTLENLIEGGVFRSREHETVRFTFDAITEALRPPLPGDFATVVQLWTKSLADIRVATRVVGNLVRVAHEGNSKLVSTHVEALSIVLADFFNSRKFYDIFLPNDFLFAPLSLIVNTLSLDMPSALSKVTQGVIDGILGAIVQQVRAHGDGYFVDRVVASNIMGLGIPMGRKFDVLTDLLALCSDDNLREKDIFDRGHKEDLIKHSEHSSSVAGALLRLASDYPREFVRLALPKLDDSRDLKGRREANVGGVLTSILRINAPSDFEDLFFLLLGAGNIKKSVYLLDRISIDHPTRALACSVTALSTPNAVAVMSRVIEQSLRSLGVGRAPRELMDKLRALMRESTPETRLNAATLIKISEPDDLEVWDEIARYVLAGRGTPSLYPVPAARANAFIDVLRSRSDSFSVEQMHYYRGDDRVEFEMAKLAMELFETREKLAAEIAGLAEDRLYRAMTSSFYVPWIEVGLRVAAHPDPEIRRKLIYFAGPRSDPSELRLNIWTQMLSGSAGLDLIAEALEMVKEQPKQSDEDKLKYLRPITMQHGPALLKPLSEWVSKEVSFFEMWDEADADRRPLNHILGLLVQTLAETHAPLYHALERRLEQTTDWIEVLRRGEVE